jgi:hypothetical protein
MPRRSSSVMSTSPSSRVLALSFRRSSMFELVHSCSAGTRISNAIEVVFAYFGLLILLWDHWDNNFWILSCCFEFFAIVVSDVGLHCPSGGENMRKVHNSVVQSNVHSKFYLPFICMCLDNTVNLNVVPSWTYVELHMQMGFTKCPGDQANVHAVILNKNHWTIIMWHLKSTCKWILFHGYQSLCIQDSVHQ